MALSNVDIIILCDLYGPLLTEKQLGMLRLFYDYDNSLSEIAEQYGVTRQAVHDCVTRGAEALADYENKLGLRRKFDKIKRLSEEIASGGGAENEISRAKEIESTLRE